VSAAVDHGAEHPRRLVHDRAEGEIDGVRVGQCGQVQLDWGARVDLAGRGPQRADRGPRIRFGPAEAGWADVEVWCGEDVRCRIRQADVGDGCSDRRREVAGVRHHRAVAVGDVRYPVQGSGGRRPQLQSVMHDEVGPPPLQQVEQVMSTVDGAGPKQVTGREAGLLLGGQLADGRVVRHPLVRLGQRDAGTVGGDAEPADQGGHVRAGRDHDVVAAKLRRPDQRHHRQQMTVSRPGAEQDPHRRNSSDPRNSLVRRPLGWTQRRARRPPVHPSLWHSRMGATYAGRVSGSRLPSAWPRHARKKWRSSRLDQNPERLPVAEAAWATTRLCGPARGR
jgi:hypothetical protein